jgi:hypothetical protein
MKRVGPEEVDQSRDGSLVHAVSHSGRWVTVTVYIEGLVGSEPRYAHEERFVCRTVEQAAETARVLREAKWSDVKDGGP